MTAPNTRTALIPGATGGIGGETAAALARHGWHIRALSRGGRPTGDTYGWDWVKGDAVDRDSVREAAQGVGAIVHAVNPPGYRGWGELVLPMIENTVEAARESGARVLLPGTVYNYGPDAFPVLREDSPQRAATHKGTIRIALERKLEEAAREGVRSLIVRFGDFFGPRPGNSWFSQGMVRPGQPLRSVTYPGKRGVGHAWTSLPDAGETFARLIERDAELGTFARFHFRGHWDPDGTQMTGTIRRVVGNPRLPVRPLPWFAFRVGAPFNLVVGVYEARSWSAQERALLETAVRALGLALERAAAVGDVGMWRERYEVAVRGSGHLLYDWDPATNQIVYGGAVEEITGYAAGELDGTLADWTGRLIHPDDREAFVHEIGRVTRSGEDAHVAFRLLHKDGSVRDVEDDGYFKRNGRGEVTRMVGFVKDVTESRRARAALLHANEELRRSNAELEQFAYVASHDLQAPIRAVTSFAELVERKYGPALDERGRLYLRQITASGQHMKGLVDDLLAFSRVHTQQRELRPVDANLVFDAVARRLHPDAQTLGATLTRGPLPVVLADGQQLDQLLQNLLGNGLKYHRAGVAPQVQVTAERDGEMWRFAVSDNGIGIDPEYFERIFVIFQRLHGREEYEGTGIGLAVCKKIVERHGGRLWLESTPGAGSTFFFSLPGA